MHSVQIFTIDATFVWLRNTVFWEKKGFNLLSEDSYSSDVSILEPWLCMTGAVMWLLASAYIMGQLISTWPLLEACVTHCISQIVTFQIFLFTWNNQQKKCAYVMLWVRTDNLSNKIICVCESYLVPLNIVFFLLFFAESYRCCCSA